MIESQLGMDKIKTIMASYVGEDAGEKDPGLHLLPHVAGLDEVQHIAFTAIMNLHDDPGLFSKESGLAAIRPNDLVPKVSAIEADLYGLRRHP